MMKTQLSAPIALLRGINVGGHNPLGMAELRALCGPLGWDDVRSHIQSGNLVFRAAGPPADLEAALEGAIERGPGLSIPVIVRTAEAWAGYVALDPYPEAVAREPNLVMLALSKRPPRAGVVEALRERADAGERVEPIGDALCIHYAGGAGRSRLPPALLDRFVGSPVTTRNWRTVLRLREMAAATP
jgi:uncharacterized protein (DUF1697 family)